MAATPSSLGTATSLLKQYYLDKKNIQNVMISAGPTFMEFKEKGNVACGGINIPFPVITGSGGGVGSQMLAAYTYSQPAKSSNFLMTRGSTFGVGQVGGEVMEASEAPDEAFIADLTLETDAKQRRVHQLMASYLFGDGTGCQGQLAGTAWTTWTLTVQDPATIIHFQAGDAIQLASAVGGAATLRGSGAVGYVLAVNIPAGTMTVGATPGQTSTAALTAIWSDMAQYDFIFLAGDVTSAGIPINQGGNGTAPAIPAGFLAWCPIGGPASSGDSFFSLNRYGNSFLYGASLDCTKDNTGTGGNQGGIRESLTYGVSQLQAVSGRPSKGALHPLAYYKLSLSLQSEGLYNGSKGQGPSGEGSFGFSSLVMPTAMGDITIVADPQCAPFLNPANLTQADIGTVYSGAMTAFLLEEATWQMISKGEVPHLDTLDGQGGTGYFLRLNNGVDAYQYQYKSYWNFGSHAPNHNAAIFLPG